MKNKLNKRTLKIAVMLILCVSLTAIFTQVKEQPLEKENNAVNSNPKNIEAETPPEMTYIPIEKDPIDYEEIEPEVEEEYIFSLMLPVNGEIIEVFSNGNLVYSITLDDFRVHNGIDIKGNILDRVYASEKGTVEKVYEDDLMGKTIIIDHENGFKTVYSNLSSTEMVDSGQTVEKGTVISGIGNTSLIEGASQSHIHFEVIKDGIYVNPLDYITP